MRFLIYSTWGNFSEGSAGYFLFGIFWLAAISVRKWDVKIGQFSQRNISFEQVMHLEELEMYPNEAEAFLFIPPAFMPMGI